VEVEPSFIVYISSGILHCLETPFVVRIREPSSKNNIVYLFNIFLLSIYAKLGGFFGRTIDWYISFQKYNKNEKLE
jgi:hypothetical protein